MAPKTRIVAATASRAAKGPAFPRVNGQKALRRVLVRKGLVINEEVLAEIKVVRRELEDKRGR